jgi:hypothetical protein
MMHKPSLRKERAIRYDAAGQMEMINNLDKVFEVFEHDACRSIMRLRFGER